VAITARRECFMFMVGASESGPGIGGPVMSRQGTPRGPKVTQCVREHCGERRRDPRTALEIGVARSEESPRLLKFTLGDGSMPR
jgi:hypothetical protein